MDGVVGGRAGPLVQLGGNGEHAQQALKRLDYFPATDLRL